MSTSRPRPRHVLVVNQHGDNRGDEAAMLAMLDALAARLAPVRFTVLHQFNDPAGSSNAGGHDVRFLPLAPRGVAFPRLVLASLLRLLHLPWRTIGGPHGREVLDAYAAADLVISAPGGPYFGDIYAWHEPLHWYYVLLGWIFRRPLVLYAPSAGPFDNRVLNPARRFVLGRFHTLTVREEVSAAHLRKLLGPDVALDVTVDAALGAEIAPLPRDAWPAAVSPPAGHKIIAVSVINGRYPDRAGVDAARRTHDDAVARALAHLARRCAPAHVVFLPQVHGRHADAPYLTLLAARLPADVSREVIADDVPSRVQQCIFAAAEVVVAGRYHPAVFAILSGVPAVCIAYEHKSIGVMEAAGLGHLVMPIDTVSSEGLVALVDKVVDTAPSIREHLAGVRPQLRTRALRTADIAAAAIDPAGTGPFAAR
jgi:colanic acid/amylovoran biosynthesis protein